MSARRLRTPATILLIAGLAGCGGGEGDGETTGTPATVLVPPSVTAPAPPVASVPAATAPPPAATTPLPGDRPPAGSGGRRAPERTVEPREEEVEPIRVPATFTIADRRLTPSRVTVPPFLAVEVTFSSDDGRPYRVTIETPQPQRVAVPADRPASLSLAGLRAGEYPLLIDGRRVGTLVAGGEVGP